MIFNVRGNDRPNEIAFLGVYQPYKINGYKNPDFNEWSGSILDLKNSDPDAINYFYSLLKPILSTRFSIVIVPSHKPGNTVSGIGHVAKKLVVSNFLCDATDCLVRFQEVQKLSHGGNRSLDVHFESIRVEIRELIFRKEVLLLDDVTTTGNSLYACRQLLLQAGASKVQCLAICKTASRYDFDDDLADGKLRFTSFQGAY